MVEIILVLVHHIVQLAQSVGVELEQVFRDRAVAGGELRG